MQSAVAISALVGTSANICTGSPRRGVAAPRDFDIILILNKESQLRTHKAGEAISVLVSTSANACTGSPRRGVAAPRDFDIILILNERIAIANPRSG